MKKSAIKPLHDRIVVERLESEEKTASGIIIPDTAKEKPSQGKVVAVGTGKILDNGTVVKLTVQVGDTVLFGKYSGTEVNVEGTKLLIMKEDDVLATL